MHHSLTESLLDLILDDLVDDRERFYGDNNDLWLPIGTNQDASHQWTEHKHLQARNQSRYLCDENPFAVNGLENRINYIIGIGHEYLLGPRRGRTADDQLLNLVSDFLEDYRRRNRWHQRQTEILRRYDRDGEVFCRQFTDHQGLITLRFVEPEHITTPTDREHTVTHGIEFGDDAETPLRYWIDGIPVEASEIQHRKANTDLNAPRGIPLYWPVRKNLKRCALILRNMSSLVEVQSAIALIRKHKGTAISQLQTARNNATDISTTNPTTARTQYFQQYQPGTIIDAPASVDYEFPAGNIEAAGIVGVLKAELRAIAARLVMPEFMFTSDASNAAYASTMVAEGPAVRMFQRLQQSQIHDDLALQYNAIRTAIEHRTLPIEAAQLEITAQAPNVQVRDFLKQAHADEIAYKHGILSAQTWSQRLGIEYDREQRNIARHQPIIPPAAQNTPRPPDDETHGSRFPTDDDPQPTPRSD
jgi:hypothetical protein